MAWPFTDSADVQQRPNNSMEPAFIEKFGQLPRSVACGRVALLRSRRDPGSIVAARLFCKRRVCPSCGPRRRRLLADHYATAIGEVPVVRRVVDRDAWPAMARRLHRLQADYLRVPAADGYLVFASAGEGEPVTDLAAALGDAFEQMPLADARGRPDRARVSSSRAWSVATKATGSGDGQGGYELLGQAKVPLAMVVKAAQDLGMYVGQVADRELAAEWAEAHVLRYPADPRVWRWFTRRVGLHQPDRHRWRGERWAA